MSHPSSEKKDDPSSETKDDPSSEMEESPSSETKEWFEHVRKNFDKEILRGIDSNVCVFQVPRLLSSAMPEAYTPQLVGLGPYHHLQPHLREMQRVKLEVAKKLHKDFHHLSVEELVSKLKTKFPDTSQIPIFFMKQVLTVACETLQDQQTVDRETLNDQQTGACEPLQIDKQNTIVKEIFPSMLVGFCKAQSPLKETIDCPPPPTKALEREHLLDILYSMVVSRDEKKTSGVYTGYSRTNKCKNEAPASNPQMSDDDRKGNNQHQEDAMKNCGRVAQAAATTTINKAVKFGGQIANEIVKFYHSNVPKKEDETSGNVVDPDEEKVLIPTASSLAKAGVKFISVDFIGELLFVPETRTFHLPTLKLGINSGVVIRNLVAYEAMAVSGALEFARFVEMMDGLINTLDDVKLLKKDGIITNRLKDVEVMHMFNGMSKCIEVNSDSKVDKEIKKVNEFYNASPNIKTLNMMDRYVYHFWKALALGSTVLLFLLMGLQTFCSAYNCASLVRK